MLSLNSMRTHYARPLAHVAGGYVEGRGNRSPRQGEKGRKATAETRETIKCDFHVLDNRLAERGEGSRVTKRSIRVD